MKRFINSNSLRQALLFVIIMVAMFACFCEAESIPVLLATKAIGFGLFYAAYRLDMSFNH